MTLSITHIIGIVLVITVIIGIGIYSGRKVKSAADFTTGGGNAGFLLVAGSIMGTLVSGQTTIGTAQLGYSYGLCAWSYTIGSGIGCTLLALGYAVPLRSSHSKTLVGIIANEFGEICGNISSALTAIGIVVSVLSQMAAVSALLTTILPISAPVAVTLATLLMGVYVIWGGMWGVGLGGVIKLFLLYMGSILGVIIVLTTSGGITGLWNHLADTLISTPLGNLYDIASSSDLTSKYLSFMSRGATKDLGNCLSVVLGILTTQTYASAIWSGRTDREAKRGALFSACMIPPIGFISVLIGVFMRNHSITTAEAEALLAAGQSIPDGMFEIASTAQAYPMFILHYLPALPAGIILGTLLVTIIGGGAGLSLGVATIVVNDILPHVTKRTEDPKVKLLVTRLAIATALIGSATFSIMVPSAIINDFGFLSMGLRAAVALAPLFAALFLPGRIPARFAIAASITGPIVVMLCKFMLPSSVDPLFPGVLVAIVICLDGLVAGKKYGMK